MKKTRRELIKDLIDEYTTFYIRESSYTFELCNAEDISLTLKIDRSNVSRILNEMFNNFELIKVKGRPTLYLSKDVLQHQYNYTNIPQVIDSHENLRDLFVTNTTKKAINIKNDLNVVGNTPEGSLYATVNLIVPAIIFEQSSIAVIVLEGKHGSGRKDFCKKLFEYGQKNKRFSKTNKIFYTNFPEIIEKRSTLFHNIEIESVGMIIVQVDNYIATDAVNQFLNSTANVYANLGVMQPIIIFLTDEAVEPNKKFFRAITPYYAKFPSLRDRPVKELVELVVNEIQTQANHINIRIKVANYTILTLVTTDFIYGTRQMLNEIRAVIARVSYQNRHMNSNVVYISNDMLQGDVYLNIREDVHLMEQARQIVLMLFPEVIEFAPNTVSEAEKLLKTINQEDRVFTVTPKLTVMQQARFDVLSLSTNSIVDFSLDNHRLSFLLTHQFYKTNICDDIPLLDYLYTQIYKMIKGTYVVQYAHDDILYKENEQSRNISNAIIEVIENKFDYPVKSIYKSYIRNFVYYALTLTVSQKISILILTDRFGLAENYAQHINQFLGMRACYSFCYAIPAVNHTLFQFTKYLSIAVSRSNKGKGVLLISDKKLPNRQEMEIVSKTNIPIVSLYKTNLYLLQEISKYIDIPSINLTVLLYNAIRNKKEIKQFYQDTTLMNKQDRAMSDLLITSTMESFQHINLQRSCEILYQIVKELCYRFEIELTNGVIVEFVFHLNFMLERYASKQVIQIEHAEEFKKQYDIIFHTVRKIIQSQKELLGYIFDENEFIIIAGLVVQHKFQPDVIEFTK